MGEWIFFLDCDDDNTKDCTEMLQLILMRGCCEKGDAIHNSLGRLVGYGVIQTGHRFHISHKMNT